MSRILQLSIAGWQQRPAAEEQARAAEALEAGCVLFLPELGFSLKTEELAFLAPETVDGKKSVSLSPALADDTIHGSTLLAARAEALGALMRRYYEASRRLLLNLIPDYEGTLIAGRTSFRPVEVQGRSGSWRKDDSRLHIDSFPASPVRGNRILRVFSNINPLDQERVWRIGEPFDAVARRFVPNIPKPAPGSSAVLRALRVTKSRRSPYDHYMLRLHDRMKADSAYQKGADQIRFSFPAGSSWIVFTDQTSHAAMSGQHALEQTFYLPQGAMVHPEKSPLRVLERITGRELI